MNQRLINYGVLIGISLTLILMIYVVVIARSEGGQCQLSPLTYGVQKLYEANNNKEISCSCTLEDPKCTCTITNPITSSGMIASSPILIFDRHNISLVDTSRPEQFVPFFNSSKIVIVNITN